MQTLNERQWPEKIMVGPGASENSCPDQQLFGLWYRVNENTSGYEDNGNITTVRRFWRQDASAQTRTALFEYAYDPLNRLLQFEADMEDANNDRRYDYTMDAYGNITQRAQETLAGVPVGSPLDLSVDPATNRLLDRAHDGLGNMTQVGPNGMVGDQLMSWWDQGHAAWFYDTTENTTWFYFYDADGKRRLKARDVYGEVDLEGDASFYFYEGEDLICQLDRGAEMQEPEAYAPRFLLLDHLGTTRAELQFVADGAAREPTITAQYDYLPYGEEIDPAVIPTEQVKFTGKQRDTESGLDNFNFRFHHCYLLRWISPDELFADNKTESPASWNLFSYVRNNPVKYMDPDGYEIQVIGTEQNSYVSGLQKCVQSFTIGINSQTNKIELTSQVDPSKLSGAELEIYKAITDQNTTAVINAVKDDHSFQFGEIDQNGKNQNNIDFGDLAHLSHKNMPPENVVGHETVERYSIAQGNTFGVAHAYATKYFGELRERNYRPQGYAKGNNQYIMTGNIIEYEIHLPKQQMRTMQAYIEFISPLPYNQANPTTVRRPQRVSWVK